MEKAFSGRSFSFASFGKVDTLDFPSCLQSLTISVLRFPQKRIRVSSGANKHCPSAASSPLADSSFLTKQETGKQGHRLPAPPFKRRINVVHWASTAVILVRDCGELIAAKLKKEDAAASSDTASEPRVRSIGNHNVSFRLFLTSYANMCVADLNVSVLPCSHRWYRLIRPCSPGTTLGTCEGKLCLEGWENKSDSCPFCAGWGLESGEHQLLGTERGNGFGTALSRTTSMSTAVSTARRDSRRSSMSSSASSIISVGGNGVVSSIAAALASPVYNAGERNRSMSQRMDSYLDDFHRGNTASGGLPDEESRSSVASTPLPDSEGASVVSAEAASNIVGKGWQRAKKHTKRLSISTVFKG